MATPPQMLTMAEMERRIASGVVPWTPPDLRPTIRQLTSIYNRPPMVVEVHESLPPLTINIQRIEEIGDSCGFRSVIALCGGTWPALFPRSALLAPDFVCHCSTQHVALFLSVLASTRAPSWAAAHFDDLSRPCRHTHSRIRPRRNVWALFLGSGDPWWRWICATCACNASCWWRQGGPGNACDTRAAGSARADCQGSITTSLLSFLPSFLLVLIILLPLLFISFLPMFIVCSHLSSLCLRDA